MLLGHIDEACRRLCDAAEPTFVDGDPAAALRHVVERPGHLWTLADMAPHSHHLEHAGRQTLNGVTRAFRSRNDGAGGRARPGVAHGVYGGGLRPDGS